MGFARVQRHWAEALAAVAVLTVLAAVQGRGCKQEAPVVLDRTWRSLTTLRRSSYETPPLSSSASAASFDFLAFFFGGSLIVAARGGRRRSTWGAEWRSTNYTSAGHAQEDEIRRDFSPLASWPIRA